MELKAIAARGAMFHDELTENIPNGEDALQEASRLLYDVLQESYQYSMDSIEVEVNGDKKGASRLYNDCVDMVRRTEAGGEKTAFLAMSVLEDTFRKALPILMVRVESILDGSSRMLENVRRLQDLFADNPYREAWAARADAYKEVIQSLGLDPADADYSDLTSVLDPLTDALTFYGTRNRHFPVMAIRRGPAGDPSVAPAFASHVQIFRTETELADAVFACGKENAVLFAGVAPRYGDTDNKLSAWYHGGFDERRSNVMRNERISEEEYPERPDLYARMMYACVKTGETLYLVRLPYQRGSYSGPEISDRTKYLYGHRASYAPYQAFYDDPPAAPENTSFLAVPRKGYCLSSIMDRDQKAWLPAFLYETATYFFGGGPIDAMDVYLPSERALVAPGGCYLPDTWIAPDGARPLPAVPSAIRLAAPVPDPASLFEKDHLKELVRTFGITADDIAVHAGQILYGRTLLEKDMRERLRTVALRLIYEHVRDATSANGMAAAMDQIRKCVLDESALAERVLSDACKGFVTVTIKGPNSPTSITDTRGCAGARGLVKAFWYGVRAKGAPPVLLEARPRLPADYAALMGIPETELAPPLDIYGPLRDFWEHSSFNAPMDMSRAGALRPVEPLMVNLCMTKTEYKAAKAKAGGKASRK